MGMVRREATGPELSAGLLVLLRRADELRRLAMALERKARVVRDDCEAFTRGVRVDGAHHEGTKEYRGV